MDKQKGQGQGNVGSKGQNYNAGEGRRAGQESKSENKNAKKSRRNLDSGSPLDTDIE